MKRAFSAGLRRQGLCPELNNPTGKGKVADGDVVMPGYARLSHVPLRTC